MWSGFPREGLNWDRFQISISHYFMTQKVGHYTLNRSIFRREHFSLSHCAPSRFRNPSHSSVLLHVMCSLCHPRASSESSLNLSSLTCLLREWSRNSMRHERCDHFDLKMANMKDWNGCNENEFCSRQKYGQTSLPTLPLHCAMRNLTTWIRLLGLHNYVALVRPDNAAQVDYAFVAVQEEFGFV